MFCFVSSSSKNTLPEGFVYVHTLIPDLEVALKYYGDDNFVGTTIEGYNANQLILTVKAAKQLQRVQEELQNYNLCLKVYDGYRPQRAVDHFVRWAKQLNDTINKAKYYPDVAKKDLFKEQYIASKSGHSRGSTVDVTLVNGNTGIELDMGSSYDFFGRASWIAHPGISKTQKYNRMILQKIMKKYGFKNYEREWWHFTLKNEPFPNTYFDFLIE